MPATNLTLPSSICYFNKVSATASKSSTIILVLICTIDDRLSVHFFGVERGQEVSGDCLLPVLSFTNILLKSSSVRQQRQWRVHAPDGTSRHKNASSYTCNEIVLYDNVTFLEMNVLYEWNGTYRRLLRGVYGGVGFSRDLRHRWDGVKAHEKSM